MPFPFTLPTTSALSLSDALSSPTHPSLPAAASSKRALLRHHLKAHKRLASHAQQTANLSTILAALTDYIPYLSALNAGLAGRPIARRGGVEFVDVVLLREPAPRWAATLSAGLNPAAAVAAAVQRRHPRPALRGLDAELAFVLHTAGMAHSLRAREALRPLLDSAAPSALASPEERARAWRPPCASCSSRTACTSAAPRRPAPPARARRGRDARAAQAGLAALALAEATLAAVLKDDGWRAAAAEERSARAADWMVPAAGVDAKRAALLVRLCVAAAGHAAGAAAELAAGLDDGAVKGYAENLRRCARAKAARFMGVAAEAGGRTGEGIAWIKGAKRELGFGSEEQGDLGMLRRVREKREDKKISRNDANWGADAGRMEEVKVLDALEQKWRRQNDTVGKAPDAGRGTDEV